MSINSMANAAVARRPDMVPLGEVPKTLAQIAKAATTPATTTPLPVDPARPAAAASSPVDTTIIQGEGWVFGMTFGYDIFLKGKDHQQSRDGLKRIRNELVHVDQVRRYGSERAFACEYGKGYLKAGTYFDNPLELEADLMVAKHGDDLPDGCKRD